MNKKLKVFLIVVGVIAVLDIGGAISGSSNKPPASHTTSPHHPAPTSQVTTTTIDKSTAWLAWEGRFETVFSRYDAHYQALKAALYSRNTVAATQYLSLLSADGADFVAVSSGPYASADSDVYKLGIDLQQMSQDGLDALETNNQADANAFGSDLSLVGSDDGRVAQDLRAGNALFLG